jgi:hypothetical protein
MPQFGEISNVLDAPSPQAHLANAAALAPYRIQLKFCDQVHPFGRGHRCADCWAG